MGFRSVLFALIVLGVGLLAGFLRATLPVYEQQLEGLGLQVQIRYDEWQVPRIKGKDLQSIYFGVGYAVAKERLFSIAKKRAVATGSLSQMFG